MIPVLLCILGLVAAFLVGRQSLGKGLIVVLAVGYGYGIVRANLPAAASHFIFDATVLGLYAGVFMRPGTPAQRFRCLTLQPWVAVLMAWPVLMFFVPMQDWIIQLIGLRGAIFFVPFLIIGGRMEEEDFNTLANGVAVLNLIAFGFAIYEFVYGLEGLFPHNAVTELIYRSNDVVGHQYYRIPSTFVVSAAYGAVMAFTIPFLAGAWARPGISLVHRRLLEAGLIAAGLGVFMSASRMSAILLAFSVVGIFTSIQLKAAHRVGIIFIILITGWLVMKQDRLQRFMTLTDTNVISERIGWSVNSTFLDVLLKYPMGNGLGGGGTSVPYFLADRLQDPIAVENEYARILLEQGVFGLILWVAFVVWMLNRAWPGNFKQQYLGRLLLWGAVAFSFLSAPIGTGLLTSIPMTALLMLSSGWLVAQRRLHESDAQARHEAASPSLQVFPTKATWARARLHE